MVTFAFRCNIACTFCMVEDVLNVFEGTSVEEFRRHAQRPGVLDGVRRIIFTGGEVTLAKDLLDYVRVARSLPGIEHVRLQTNAVRLARPDVMQPLLEAGVDEFFVSFHAPDRELCAAITQRPKAFDSIVSGMRAIVDAGATLITNTAMVRANYSVLPEIVDVVAPLGPASMEFWNYWPRADEDGARGEMARVSDVRPFLLRALDRCREHRIPPVVKWFPRCLLGDYARFLDDSQPPAMIEDEYWEREPSYACIYEGICEHAATRCAGLSASYVLQYGWEQDVLQPSAPRPVESPREMFDTLTDDADPAKQGNAQAARWLARFELAVGDVVRGWRLDSATWKPDAAEVVIVFAKQDTAVRVSVRVVGATDRYFDRTKSYTLAYGRVPQEQQRDVARLMSELVARIDEQDGGGLGLP